MTERLGLVPKQVGNCPPEANPPSNASESGLYPGREAREGAEAGGVRSAQLECHQPVRSHDVPDDDYARTNFDETGPAKRTGASRVVGQLILEVFNEFDGTMTPNDFFRHIGDEAAGRLGIDIRSLGKRLSDMAGRGRIDAVSRGVYARKGFSDTGHEQPNRVAISAQIIEYLSANQAMKAQDVADYLERNGCEGITLEKAYKRLSSLARKGEIQSLAGGVFARRDFDGRNYQSPRTATSRVFEIVEASAGPIRPGQVVVALPSDGQEELSLDQANTCLRGLLDQGKIQRLGRGVYARLGFEGPYIPESVAARPRKTTGSRQSSKGSGYNPETNGDSYDSLRVGPGRPRALSIGARIGRVTRDLIGPITDETVDDVIAALNRDGLRPVDSKYIRPLIEKKLQRQSSLAPEGASRPN